MLGILGVGVLCFLCRKLVGFLLGSPSERLSGSFGQGMWPLYGELGRRRLEQRRNSASLVKGTKCWACGGGWMVGSASC